MIRADRAALLLAAALGLAACPDAKTPAPAPTVAVQGGSAPARLTASALARARSVLDGRRNALRITIGENGHLGISSDHERPGDTAFVDSGVPILVPSLVADAFSGIVIDWASDANGRVGFCFEGTARALDHSLARELRARLEATSKSRVDAPRPGLGPGEDLGGAR